MVIPVLSVYESFTNTNNIYGQTNTGEKQQQQRQSDTVCKQIESKNKMWHSVVIELKDACTQFYTLVLF